MEKCQCYVRSLNEMLFVDEFEKWKFQKFKNIFMIENQVTKFDGFH